MVPDSNTGPAPDSESVVFPELTQAFVDRPLLERYFDDLHRCAELLEVLPKLAARERAVLDRVWSLAEAREALLAGALRGVQLRYRYDGDEWWDTLLSQEGHVRIVRTRRPGETAQDRPPPPSTESRSTSTRASL